MNNNNDLNLPLGRYAGFITRLAAWGIDRLIVGIILSIIGFFADYLTNALELRETLQFIVWIIVIVLSITVQITYHVGLIALAGQTIGKAIMGVRVVRLDGSRISFGRAFVRYLATLLSGLLLFLGYLMALVDSRRQTLHDKIAGTIVVYSWPAVSPLEEQARFTKRIADFRNRQNIPG